MKVPHEIQPATLVWQERGRLIEAIVQHRRGQLALDALYARADAYIAEIKAHAKRTGRKLPVPSRGHVIRALS